MKCPSCKSKVVSINNLKGYSKDCVVECPICKSVSLFHCISEKDYYTIVKAGT